jgi:hypothetical protein
MRFYTSFSLLFYVFRQISVFQLFFKLQFLLFFGVASFWSLHFLKALYRFIIPCCDSSAKVIKFKISGKKRLLLKSLPCSKLLLLCFGQNDDNYSISLSLLSCDNYCILVSEFIIYYTVVQTVPNCMSHFMKLREKEGVSSEV